MTVPSMTLSPQLVQKAILAEYPDRRLTFSVDNITDIFRYGSTVGHAVEVHAQADRCMALARQSILHFEKTGESFCSGSVIVADELTAGKGRFQRDWHAPKGGIWLALTLVNTLLPEHSVLLPLAAGVACCETVRHYKIPAHIKWVNDVHVNGFKVAGILAETMIGPQTGEEYILLGIGLNVNNRSFPDLLAGKAAGMHSFVNEPLDLSQVSAMLVAKLAWNIGLLHFEEQRCLSGSGKSVSGQHLLLRSWRELSDTIGKQVQYGFNVVSAPQYNAKVTDIDDAGALVMRLADGSYITEAGGEISYI